MQSSDACMRTNLRIRANNVPGPSPGHPAGQLLRRSLAYEGGQEHDVMQCQGVAVLSQGRTKTTSHQHPALHMYSLPYAAPQLNLSKQSYR